MQDKQDVRMIMSSYWKSYSSQANKKEMLLNHDAEAIAELEEPEILSLLPSLHDKHVVELGAGIGRFTCHIAQSARSVLAVDFMKSFIDKNQEVNGHMSNISFLQADVTQMDLPSNRESIKTFWSTKKSKPFLDPAIPNPTEYRSALLYTAFINTAQQQTNKFSAWGFDTIFAQKVDAHMQVDGQDNQVCWLLKRVPKDSSTIPKSVQAILDEQKHSLGRIQQNGCLFGEGFLSPGGQSAIASDVKTLNMQEGQKVLDVGSGVGGNAFYMSEMYNVDVLGIEPCFTKVDYAWGKGIQTNNTKAKFKMADIAKVSLPLESFHVVYGRDGITQCHVQHKANLFKRFLSWLKPGGRLLITDYCSGDNDQTMELKNHMAQTGFGLLSPDQYEQMLTGCGFLKVKIEDRTEIFLQNLKTDLEKVRRWPQQNPKEDLSDISSTWCEKAAFCMEKQLKWVLIYAERAVD